MSHFYDHLPGGEACRPGFFDTLPSEGERIPTTGRFFRIAPDLSADFVCHVYKDGKKDTFSEEDTAVLAAYFFDSSALPLAAIRVRNGRRIYRIENLHFPKTSGK